MIETYGQLIMRARRNCSPPMTAKELAEKINVRPPFITDIEKGRRLPSLATQKKIKLLLSGPDFPETLFDDLAALANSDTRIVAEDLSQALRKSSTLRTLVRKITGSGLSLQQISEISSGIGGKNNEA